VLLSGSARSFATHLLVAAFTAAAGYTLGVNARGDVDERAERASTSSDVADVAPAAATDDPAPRRRPEPPLRTRSVETDSCPACPRCSVEKARWPEHIDTQYDPERFGETMREVVAELGLEGALEFDCDEFPCLAAIHDVKMKAEEADRVREAIRRRYSGETKEIAHRHAAVGPSGAAHVAVFGIYPSEEEDPALSDGIERRIQTMISDAKSEVE
jgi:hypothetical protein